MQTVVTVTAAPSWTAWRAWRHWTTWWRYSSTRTTTTTRRRISVTPPDCSRESGFTSNQVTACTPARGFSSPSNVPVQAFVCIAKLCECLLDYYANLLYTSVIFILFFSMTFDRCATKDHLLTYLMLKLHCVDLCDVKWANRDFRSCDPMSSKESTVHNALHCNAAKQDWDSATHREHAQKLWWSLDRQTNRQTDMLVIVRLHATTSEWWRIIPQIFRNFVI